LWHNGEYK